MITDKQVMILGAGNMGSCLLGGICRAKLVPPDDIIITGLRKDYLESLAGQWGVHWTTDNKKCVEQADVIMLCLKPQAIGRVLTDKRIFKP